MASAKDTFEPATFGAMTFACGTWRGVGALATLVGRWSDIEQLHSDRILARLMADRLRVSAYADRSLSKLSADRGLVSVHADRERIEVRG